MSAAEVIEQFKSLPEQEQKKVVAFVLHEAVEPSNLETAKTDAEFEVAAQWGVREHRELLRRLAQ